MSTLVVLPIESEFSSISDKLLSCAQSFGSPISVLIHDSMNQADYIESLSSVENIDAIYSLVYPEDATVFSSYLADWVKQNSWQVVLASDLHFSQSTMPRVAALLGVGQVSNITEVVSAKCFKHPIYAGNIIETVEVLDETVIATVRCSSFSAASKVTQSLSVTELPALENAPAVAIIEHIVADSDSVDVSTAKWVIGIGRGAEDSSVYSKLCQIAESAGFAVGGTRAVVDAGLMSNDKQLGQTGKVIAPDVYIAVGISGAIQHLAGISQAKTIFAVNCDAEAPIMQMADYAFVGKAEDVIPELEAALVK